MHNDENFKDCPFRRPLFVKKRADWKHILQNDQKMDKGPKTSTKTLIHPVHLLLRLQFLVINPNQNYSALNNHIKNQSYGQYQWWHSPYFCAWRTHSRRFLERIIICGYKKIHNHWIIIRKHSFRYWSLLHITNNELRYIDYDPYWNIKLHRWYGIFLPVSHINNM